MNRGWARGRVKDKSLLSRLTGISAPVGNINRVPSADEQPIAEELLTFLSDRRALYRSYDEEIGSDVIQSVLKIRARLTMDLEGLPNDSVLREHLLAMKSACRRFLDQNQRQRGAHNWQYEARLRGTLGELRALFGVQIARMAYEFDLRIHGPLADILPPEIRTTPEA